jgi:hypothetical protein
MPLGEMDLDTMSAEQKERVMKKQVGAVFPGVSPE